MTARFDRQTHHWNYWTPGSGVPQNYTMFTFSGQTCWQLAGDILYRLNSKTSRWDNISEQLGKGKGAIPVKKIQSDDKDLWLVTGRANPHSASNAHIAVEGTFAPLYHCRIRTEGTTALLPVNPAPGKTLTAQLVTIMPHTLLLATLEGAYRLDRKTERWQPISPPALPAGLPPIKPRAVYESQSNFWLVGEDSTLRFHK